MATFLTILTLIAGVFSLILLGALGRKLGLLAYEARQTLNNIIIFFCLPALIFQAARKAGLNFIYFKVGLTSFLISFTTLALALLVVRFLALDRQTKGAFLLASGVGNTGYLGYPITQLVLGSPAVIKAVFFDIFGTVMLLFTAGIYFASKYGQADGVTKDSPAWKQALLYATPNLAALGVGFILKDFTLPSFLTLVLNSLAKATTAIIMLAIGISLSFNISNKDTVGALLLVGLKLLIMPLVALLLVLLFGLTGQSRSVVILQASMPVALMSFVIGDLYGLNRRFLSAIILMSTALSFFTIPFWQLV